MWDGSPPAACAWCGAPLRDGERLAGRTRCRGCGVATTDPWPTAAALDRAYGEWYRPGSGRFSGRGDALLRLTRGSLARRLDRIAPPGPVLDVGAGDGTLLAALRRRGRAATGLERDGSGDPAAESIDAVEGSWAAIVFWHSLEHLPEPASALARAAKLLAPGGVIVIAVPNSASLQARVFGDRWLALDPPRHLVHLTEAALRARLQELGLRVERVGYLRGGQVVFGWLEGLVGSLPGRPRLYEAIRRPAARALPLPPACRAATLLAGALLLPVALAATAVELLARRGGTVYVEARG
ncbi:MAG TPA: class I SAM-dependent methyltransferase [Solirubrobacterales bacterium]|nr:class I SAM-dependent methyltransferase [Solirubrobacterales bacterium]